ncbi:hypothetical protein ACO2Q3_22490 [Caulobacter sp. KR2-114]|uniref:hypothetical protein n=1 Tax=Caulobacter sp. KR2-114 TaxID=3400912 RepID=UPI003C06C7F6
MTAENAARVLTAAVAALAAAWPAAAATPARTGGDKVSGSAGRPVAQPLPARLPRSAPTAPEVVGRRTETAKQLQAPTTLDFEVGPKSSQTQMVVIAAGELIVHLEPDRYGDGEGHMTVTGPGAVVVCQAALEACMLHITETGRYALTVSNHGAAKGAFPMVFSLPRALPSLGNAAKARPR